MRKLKQGEKEQKSKPKDARYSIFLKEYAEQKLTEKHERTGMAKRQILLNYIDEGIMLEESPINRCVE